jgi:hypothetical protein
MARSTIEVAFLGTQKLEFSSKDGHVKIVKVFYGDEPDGETENGLSIVSMDVPAEVADEIFAAGANLAPLEPIRITFEVARAGKQKGNNLCLHIEPVKSSGSLAAPTTTSSTTQPQANKGKGTE